MCRRALSFLIVSLLLAFPLSAQLFLTVKPMPQEQTWGVYVRPCDTLQVSENTVTGTGQITIVTNMGSLVSDVVNHGGTWNMDSKVLGPLENPTKWYYSFGLHTDFPPIEYKPKEETLLFTFRLSNQDGSAPELIDNANDPFAQQPNSVNTNPGNELSVVDFGKSPLVFYHYTGNYQPDAFQCTELGTISSAVALPGPTFKLTLAPNPTGEELTIRLQPIGYLPLEGVLEIRTIDLRALVVKEWKGEQQVVLHVGHLPAGIYTVVFKSRQGSVVMEKFLKQ